MKEYRHDSLVYYKPRVPSSSCDARTQQLQAPYHPFSNISRPLFRTTYKAIPPSHLTLLRSPDQNLVSRRRGRNGERRSSSYLAHQLLVAAIERVRAICRGIHVWVRHRGGVAVSSVEWCAIVHVPPVAGVTPRLETEKEMGVRGGS